jgi:GNAT superfamily N-acetyltransferase
MNNLERIDNVHAEELEDKGFSVYRGWNSDVASQLVRLSLQPHILATTPNDATHRFRDVPMANRWHDKGSRSIYTLQTDEVTGLVWYDIRLRDEPELSDARYTFAIRMYEASQGKKLAHGFMQAAHHDFADRKGDPAVWLDVDLDNSAAKHLYSKFGYKTTHEEKNREVMVYRPER